MADLQKEEARACRDGRRVKVERRARRVNLGVDGKEFCMDLLAETTTQEILLGYDCLREHVKGWNSGEGKLTFVEEHQEAARSRRKSGPNCWARLSRSC